MAEEHRGYGQYCPISRALEVLGERWTMLIVRDLLLGNTRFNELSRASPGLSRTLLSKRLRQLERAGIVEHVDDCYELTQAGRELEPVVFGLGEWGGAVAVHRAASERARPADPDVVDPPAARLLHRARAPLGAGVPLQRRPPSGSGSSRTRAGASVCTADPGYEVDATIHSDLMTLYRVWLGRVPMEDVLRAGELRVDGHPQAGARPAADLRAQPAARPARLSGRQRRSAEQVPGPLPLAGHAADPAVGVGRLALHVLVHLRVGEDQERVVAAPPRPPGPRRRRARARRPRRSPRRRSWRRRSSRAASPCPPRRGRCTRPSRRRRRG